VRAGHLLGNHTRSHLDLNETSLADYLADIDANEAPLRALFPEGDTRWRVFRYPYLFEGNNLATRASVRAHLKEHHYRIAEVTIDFSDWAWNEPYVRCLAKHDEQAIKALERSYLMSADNLLRWSDLAARQLLGRRIKHVLLLHAGAFDGRMMDRLLTQLEREHVRFISLDRALADPIYAEEPDQPELRSGTLLWQLRMSRSGRDRAFDLPRARPDALLDVVCR
jgi:peptidoglycan/xylan/chitin deacetylase (PgdA/CDA1 family)